MAKLDRPAVLMSALSVLCLIPAISGLNWMLGPAGYLWAYPLGLLAVGLGLAAIRRFGAPLWACIIGAMILGGLVGVWLGPEAKNLKLMGDVFLRLIQMLSAPLIFVTLTAAVSALGSTTHLGTVGIRTTLLYAFTAVCAVSIGIGLALLIQPGTGLGALTAPGEAQMPDGLDVNAQILGIVPKNPVKSLADGEVLQIVTFSILLGTGILMSGAKGEPLKQAFESAAEALTKITSLVMEVAPIGVFALMAFTIGRHGLEMLAPLAKLIGLVYLGCLIMAFLVYGPLVKLFARLPLVRFFASSGPAALVAYSTASSNATLPVTMICAEKNLNVPPRIAGFVIAAGATINMDGTALYLAAAGVFASQLYGIPLEPMQYLAIASTALISAVGAAGIPGAGLIMMSLVLASAGLPIAVIGIIAGVDRIMDMARTTVNVIGDLMAAVVVAKWDETSVPDNAS